MTQIVLTKNLVILQTTWAKTVDEKMKINYL